MPFIFLFILSAIIFVYTGQPSTGILPLLFFIVGRMFIRIGSDKCNVTTHLKLYSISFVVFLAYAVACYMFMLEHGYNHLTVSDTITAYIPDTEYVMDLNFKEMFGLIFHNKASRFEHSGVMLVYWAYVGKLGAFLGGELYFDLQVSILFLSAFVPVFLYKFLNQFEVKNAYRCALIYAFCSIFSLYATLILRDAPIAALYMIALSYIKSRNRTKKNIVFILCIVSVYYIRPSMGFFLCLFYVISFIPEEGLNSKNKGAGIIGLILASLAIIYFFNQYSFVESFERNSRYMDIQESRYGAATLYKFSFLPPVIEELVKSIYIHISPIPGFTYMGIIEPVSATRNIMHFPTLIGALYNYIILGLIIIGIGEYKNLDFAKQDIFIFLGALVFLMLQSSSTEQRRLMICYPILFVFAVVAFQRLPKQLRKDTIVVSVALFLILQVVGVL